jgi:hypothetical protein
MDRLDKSVRVYGPLEFKWTKNRASSYKWPRLIDRRRLEGLKRYLISLGRCCERCQPIGLPASCAYAPIHMGEDDRSDAGFVVNR